MSLERKKRYFVNHYEAEPMARLCRTLRIDRKTGYNWLARYKSGGLTELLTDDRGGRPKQEIPHNVREAVIVVRKEQGWNEKKIFEHLRTHEIHTSYYRVRQALAEANVLGVAPPRRKRTFKDFKRPRPNHLWAYDFSILDDRKYLFALIDDYSRYLVDAQAFDSATTENALTLCRRAFAWHGAPFQLMTDHGVQFWNNKTDSPNTFGPALEALGVEHILAGVKHPQTNVKSSVGLAYSRTKARVLAG